MTGLRQALTRAAVVAGFRANAVNFDGATRLPKAGGDFTGNADSKLVTGSLWVNAADDDVYRALLYGYYSTDNEYFYIYRYGLNNINIAGKDAGGNVRLNVFSSAGSVQAADGWVHVLFSFDMSDPLKRHLYINDVSDLATVITYSNNILKLTYSNPGWRVGANGNNSEYWLGDMAEVWFAPGVYIDFSITANRRKFISATGKPVDLGANGSVPTGSPPILFLSGPTASWHTNKGSGGGLAEVGTLVDAATSPSD